MKRHKPIVFFHVPKCGGTTLNEILMYIYGDAQVLKIYEEPSEKTEQRYRELKLQRLRDYPIVTGHFSVGNPELEENADCVTMLREPRSRLQSMYRYIRQVETHDLHEIVCSRSYSIRDCIEQKISSDFDNGLVRQFSGIGDEVPFGEVDEAHFRQASKNLQNKFLIVGLQERFNESLWLFKTLLDWKWPFYIHANKTARIDEASQVLTPELVEKSARWDSLLYGEGVELFKKSLACTKIKYVELALFNMANIFFQRRKALRSPTAGTMKTSRQTKK